MIYNEFKPEFLAIEMRIIKARTYAKNFGPEGQEESEEMRKQIELFNAQEKALQSLLNEEEQSVSVKNKKRRSKKNKKHQN